MFDSQTPYHPTDEEKRFWPLPDDTHCFVCGRWLSAVEDFAVLVHGDAPESPDSLQPVHWNCVSGDSASWTWMPPEGERLPADAMDAPMPADEGECV